MLIKPIQILKHPKLHISKMTPALLLSDFPVVDQEVSTIGMAISSEILSSCKVLEEPWVKTGSI
jgi:hypothetical protein